MRVNAQGVSNQQRPSGAYKRIGPVGFPEQSDDVDGGGWTVEFVQCLILSWKRTRRLPGASCAKVGDFRGFEVWMRVPGADPNDRRAEIGALGKS